MPQDIFLFLKAILERIEGKLDKVIENTSKYNNEKQDTKSK